MASLLDSIQGDIGIILGGAAQATQSAASQAAAATSDSISTFIGSKINKGASVVQTINQAPSTAPKPTVTTTLPAVVSSNKNLILLAIAGILALVLVLKR